MGWSVGYRSPPESDLIDEILLAAGKALYLTNLFEAKCSYVLRIATLVDITQRDPVLTLEEAASLLPGDKMLGSTLRELLARTDVTISQEDITLLEKARKARNYIAHEGAGSIGDAWSRSVRQKIEGLRQLHAAVNNLARGDNIVSAWVYSIEEPREPLPLTSADYLRYVESWVFGHVPPEWLDPAWEPNYQPPRSLKAALAYEPWYSRSD